MTDNFDESGTAEADPAEEMTWNDFTVPQLKEELTVRGLDTSGKKAELVERLEKYDNGTFLFQLLMHHASARCHANSNSFCTVWVRGAVRSAVL